MKIGILTFSRPHNYGAQLQAYGLKKHLDECGYETEIIDYWPPGHSKKYSLLYGFKALSLVSKFKKFLWLIFDVIRIYKRRRVYDWFAKTYLGLTSNVKFKDHESLKSVSYDIVIYGSDQIWRKDPITGFDPAYFGYFINAPRKLTFAASMGVVKVDETEYEFIQNSVCNFDKILVRERELQGELLKITGKEFPIVLDPVFLLDKCAWDSMSKPNRDAVKRKYVFLFDLLDRHETRILAEKLSILLGCEIVSIPGTNVNPKLWGRKYRQTESAAGFLSLIKNAEFIVTNSFHCVAFSIIFEKRFYATGMGNNSRRVQDLLDSLQISSRYLNEAENLTVASDVDYVALNQRLNTLREESKRLLAIGLRGDFE